VIAPRWLGDQAIGKKCGHRWIRRAPKGVYDVAGLSYLGFFLFPVFGVDGFSQTIMLHVVVTAPFAERFPATPGAATEAVVLQFEDPFRMIEWRRLARERHRLKCYGRSLSRMLAKRGEQGRKWVI
jgi:hypothetical protein